jgi:hypothetical protein
MKRFTITVNVPDSVRDIRDAESAANLLLSIAGGRVLGAEIKVEKLVARAHYCDEEWKHVSCNSSL